MAIKEILDILGENPTESVYSEGKCQVRWHAPGRKVSNAQ